MPSEKRMTDERMAALRADVYAWYGGKRTVMGATLAAGASAALDEIDALRAELAAFRVVGRDAIETRDPDALLAIIRDMDVEVIGAQNDLRRLRAELAEWAESAPVCRHCSKRHVERERLCYATPVCFTCLPPPEPIPVTPWPPKGSPNV